MNKKTLSLLVLAMFILSLSLDMAGAAPKKKSSKRKTASSSSSSSIMQETGNIITVVAEGRSPVIDGRKAEARNSARRELIRNALDLAVGSFVESVTKVENYETIVDRIFSQSEGMVRQISVIDEWVDEEEMLHMKAECKVSEVKLDSKLGPAVIDAIGNPRIMIMLEQGAAQSAVQTVFEKSGYTIINPSHAQVLKDIDLDAARAAGDYSKIRDTARNFRADVIIMGHANAATVNKQRVLGQTLYAVASSVRLEAVLSDTAQTIGSEEFSWRPKRAADCSLSYSEGAARGLNECGVRAASSIVNKIAYALTQGIMGGIPGRTVKIIITNIDYGTARNLKNALSLLQGVSGVYQRRYVNGNELELDVVSDKSADELAGVLADSNFNITGVTAALVEGDAGGVKNTSTRRREVTESTAVFVERGETVFEVDDR